MYLRLYGDYMDLEITEPIIGTKFCTHVFFEILKGEFKNSFFNLLIGCCNAAHTNISFWLTRFIIDYRKKIIRMI